MTPNSMYQCTWQVLANQCGNCGHLFLALVILLVMCQPIPVYATTPRTSALGGDNTFFEDDSNVLRWYGSLVDYGNQVLVGTGHHDFAKSGISWSDSKSGFGAGAHVDLDSQGKWGTAAIYFHERMRDGDTSTSIENDPQNALTLMYGRDMGPVVVGLSFRHGSKVWDTAIDTVAAQPMSHRNLSRTTLGLGLRADLSSTSYLDVAFDLHGIDWLDSDIISSDKDAASWGNLSFRTRAFFAIGSTMAIVPEFEFWSEDYITLLDDYILAEAHENKIFRLGCGLNFFPNSDNFMLVSASYLRQQDDSVINYSHNFLKRSDQFNATIATETRWNHWLTLRGSAGFKYFTHENEPDIGKNSNDTLFPLSFGAGIHLGGADLDVSIASLEPGLLNTNWGHLSSDEPSVQAPGSWFSASLRYLF